MDRCPAENKTVVPQRDRLMKSPAFIHAGKIFTLVTAATFFA